jgi:hypothetical protein
MHSWYNLSVASFACVRRFQYACIQKIYLYRSVRFPLVDYHSLKVTIKCTCEIIHVMKSINTCVYCHQVGPKHLPPAEKEQLTRCMGVESLRVLKAVGTSSINEATKATIEAELRSCGSNCAGCMLRQSEDVPIFFHQSCVPGGTRDRKTSSCKMLWSWSKDSVSGGRVYSVQPGILHRFCHACVQEYTNGGGKVDEGVAASEELQEERKCKNATYHMNSMKRKVIRLADLGRNTLVFVFGESRHTTIISPELQALLREQPTLEYRISSLETDLAAGLEIFRSAAPPPNSRVHSHLPTTLYAPRPHHQPPPSSNLPFTPSSHCGAPRELPLHVALPVSSSLPQKASSIDVEPCPRNDATNLYPPSLPGFTFECISPPTSKDLSSSPADHAPFDLNLPSMPRGDHQLGCSLHNDVHDIFPQLPGLVPLVSPKNFISQRLPGHPPFTLEELSSGGACRIQGLTKTACVSTMHGVFRKSWLGGHDATVSDLRGMVTQATAHASASGITWKRNSK